MKKSQPDICCIITVTILSKFTGTIRNLLSPWTLTLTEPIPEVFEFPPPDWLEIYLVPGSRSVQRSENSGFRMFFFFFRSILLTILEPGTGYQRLIFNGKSETLFFSSHCISYERFPVERPPRLQGKNLSFLERQKSHVSLTFNRNSRFRNV